MDPTSDHIAIIHLPSDLSAPFGHHNTGSYWSRGQIRSNLIFFECILTICYHDTGNYNGESPFKADSKNNKSDDDIEEGWNYIEQDKL